MSTEELIVLPCDIPIKVIGLKTNDFKSHVLDIIFSFCKKPEVSVINENVSSTNKYISITINVRAINRKHIDKIFTQLSASDKITMVL